MKPIRQLDKFQSTKSGKLVFGLIELVIALVLANLAVGSGDILQWILAIIFFAGSLQNFICIIGKLMNGKRPEAN